MITRARSVVPSFANAAKRGQPLWYGADEDRSWASPLASGSDCRDGIHDGGGEAGSLHSYHYPGARPLPTKHMRCVASHFCLVHNLASGVLSCTESHYPYSLPC